MMRYSMYKFKKVSFSAVVFLFCSIVVNAQSKIEREHRILKSQFPDISYKKETLGEDVKKIKYYKEVGTKEVVYSTKFKKAKLHYQMQYSTEGDLQNIAFRVKQVDFPFEVFTAINSQLADFFDRYRITRMYQQYPILSKDKETSVLKNAFMNLMVPNMEYKLLVKGKKDDKKVLKEFWFTASGVFVKERNMLPVNFDRALY